MSYCGHEHISQDEYGHYCSNCDMRLSIKEIPERLFEMIKKEIGRKREEDK